MASSLSSPHMVPHEAASLLGLAVEIRSEILKHLFGGVILHVSSNWTRRPAKTLDQDHWHSSYRYFVCCDFKAEEAVRNRTVPSWRRTWEARTCEYRISDDQWQSSKFERDDRNARRYFHMAIAKVNRQLYKESLWAFLEYHTFSFCEPRAWKQFRNNHTAAQLDHMRAIELFTMTPEIDTENGHGKGDPYARATHDHYWRFKKTGILKNVTRIVLGLRHPHKIYSGKLNQTIETMKQALDSAFGDLSGLQKLKQAEVFIVLDHMRTIQGTHVDDGEMEQIRRRLSVFASNLEAELLAFNPHNIAPLAQQEETQHRD